MGRELRASRETGPINTGGRVTYRVEGPASAARPVVDNVLRSIAPSFVRSIVAQVRTQAGASDATDMFAPFGGRAFLVDRSWRVEREEGGRPFMVFEFPEVFNALSPADSEMGWLLLAHYKTGRTLREVSFVRTYYADGSMYYMLGINGTIKSTTREGLVSNLADGVSPEDWLKKRPWANVFSECFLAGQAISTVHSADEIKRTPVRSVREDGGRFRISSEGLLERVKVMQGLGALFETGEFCEAEIGLMPFAGISGPITIRHISGGRRQPDKVELAIGGWDVSDQIARNIQSSLAAAIESAR